MNDVECQTLPDGWTVDNLVPKEEVSLHVVDGMEGLRCQCHPDLEHCKGGTLIVHKRASAAKKTVN